MKILFYKWNSFMNQGIEKGFHELGIEYDTFYYQQKDWEVDDGIVEKLSQMINKKIYTIVFSVDFAPLVAKVCNEKDLLYVSWVYDAPIHIRDLEPLTYQCNRIFFFDRNQVNEYRKMGVNAFHMPLAADINFCKSKKNSAKYEAEVSMVGRLYQTDFLEYSKVLSPWTKGYLDGILNAQMKIYGGYFLGELLDEKLIEKCNVDFRAASEGKFTIEKRELEYMMACEITRRERYVALALLSNHFNVKLYSQDAEPSLQKVKFMGCVDYYSEMPEVFQKSKINLNISLKIIPSGVPLRVFDILGSGGFALTNFQPELMELFVPDRDIVIYENLEDMYEKARFYLTHEDERVKIARNGYETASKHHTFHQRLEEILRISMEG